jgi:hypothetical protein
MITEDCGIKWIRQRITASQYENAATLAREFPEEYPISDVFSPDFARVINAGFAEAPEIARKSDDECSHWRLD